VTSVSPEQLRAARQQFVPVPLKYHEQSELTITIEPGSGKIIKNFELDK